jgi:hypothetical protein
MQSMLLCNGILCWYPFVQNSSVSDLSKGFLTDLLKEKYDKILDGDANEKADYAVVWEPHEISDYYLQYLHSKLKPTGKLLLIFENPEGIRKICKEVFDSIKFNAFNVRNLTYKEQVKRMLETVGFKKQKWYYPLANHRITFEVFSDNFMTNEFLGNQPFLFF